MRGPCGGGGGARKWTTERALWLAWLCRQRLASYSLLPPLPQEVLRPLQLSLDTKSDRLKGRALAITQSLIANQALPAEAQALVANVQNPQNLINQLPVSDAIKQQMNQVVPTSAEGLLAAIQDPDALKAQIQTLVQAQVLAQVQQAQAQVQALLPAEITVLVPTEEKKSD